MSREINNVRRMRRILEMHGARTIKTHGDAMSSGEPDILACLPAIASDVLFGFCVAIEVKQKGKKPRPLQHAVLAKYAQAGAIAIWSDDPDEIWDIITNELESRLSGRGTMIENGRPKVDALPRSKGSES